MKRYVAGYHVPLTSVIGKLLPNLKIDRAHLEDFRLYYAIDRWLFSRNFSNVGSIAVPSTMDDFESLPPNTDPDVSGVLFFFVKGYNVDALNAQEPTKEDEERFRSTQVDQNTSTTRFPDVALTLKKVLIDEGKLESSEIQWTTIIDQWYIHNRDPIGPMVTDNRNPIDETMVFKGDLMTFFQKMKEAKERANDSDKPMQE